tara:strand:+ start:866 stop:1021 length:156 start_codon:yes stop_codon:yes gene_type:complete
MYRIVHNESGKECVVEVGKYNRKEIIEQAIEKLNLPIDIKSYGQIKIIPLV